MATYSSPAFSAANPIAYHGDAGSVQLARFVITTTAALTTADIFNFGYMPANARIVGGYLAPTDMDTNGSPTLTLNIGDAGSGTRLFSANTGGQTGTNTSLTVSALGYKYTAKTLITGAPAANAATGVAGTIELVLLYVVEDPTTT